VYRVGPITKQTPWQYSGMSAMSNRDGRSGQQIAPVVGEPGLIGYECPNCMYVTSVLVQLKRENEH
jgi:hypothetical protein